MPTERMYVDYRYDSQTLASNLNCGMIITFRHDS